jgi:thymidylate kinase
MERVCLRGGRDRFEAAGYTFLERVRTGFSSLAQREPLRINTIEASEEPQVLASTIFSLVEVSSSR